MFKIAHLPPFPYFSSTNFPLLALPEHTGYHAPSPPSHAGVPLHPTGQMWDIAAPRVSRGAHCLTLQAAHQGDPGKAALHGLHWKAFPISFPSPGLSSIKDLSVSPILIFKVTFSLFQSFLAKYQWLLNAFGVHLCL